MSRYYWNRKTTVEECKEISTFFLKKRGYFNSDHKNGIITWLRNTHEAGSIGICVDMEKNYARVSYSTTDINSEEMENKNYNICIRKTACKYGGFRYWFQCPSCMNKFAKLYIKGKSDFGCRHCLNLSYKTRNKGGWEKTVGKVVGYLTLDKLLANMRTKYYKGQPTRKYKRWLEYSNKLEYAFIVAYSLIIKMNKRMGRKYGKLES